MLSTASLRPLSSWATSAPLASRAVPLALSRHAVTFTKARRRFPPSSIHQLHSRPLLSSSFHQRGLHSLSSSYKKPLPASLHLLQPRPSPLMSSISPFHVQLATALLLRAFSSPAGPAVQRSSASPRRPVPEPSSSRTSSSAPLRPITPKSQPSSSLGSAPAPPPPRPGPAQATLSTPNATGPPPPPASDLTRPASKPAEAPITPPTPTLAASPPAPSVLGTLAEPQLTRGQRLWARVKKEVRHYVDGTKLLYAEIKVAFGLTLQVLHGHELNRRERKQLTRTSADILRLVPFLVIVIVPFMEFALPVLLKLFPNMLPSTYLDHKGEEAKLKKQLAAKIEMARFLQDTTALMAKQLLEKDSSQSSEERRVTVSSFQSLMDKVKRGESVKNSDILAVSRLFDEDFTLEHLNHEQLAAMCRLVDLRVFGSDWVLRYKLNKKLDELRDDDKAIQKEGVDSLTLKELQEACRARGIHSERSEDYMRRKLNDWLELSLEHDVPISLLVLSRAFSVSLAGTRDVDLSADLAQTLKHIPDVVVQDTEQAIVDLSDDAREKLQLIKKEEQLTKRSKPATPTPGPPAAPSVVGLTEIKEALEELKENNDSIEEDIDSAVAVKAKETMAEEAKKAGDAIPLPSQAASSAKEVAPLDGDQRPAVDVEKAKEKGVEKKKVLTVDRLNDSVENLLDRVQAELKAHESAAGKEGEARPPV